MENGLTEKQIYKYIDSFLNILTNNFKPTNSTKIPYTDIYEMVCDLEKLIGEYNNFNYKKCSDIVVKRYIPVLDLLIKIDYDKDRCEQYVKLLKNAYRIGARTSFEHYMVYREWEDRDKFFAPRYEIMEGYVHYLQEIETNPNFRLLIANMPSGYGKLLANNTPVLTRNGWKNHGDLVVGDEVISPSGEFIKVTHVHPKRLANVKITFEDGEEILCHNQHEWQIYDRNAQKEKHIETNYMIDKFKEKDGKRNRFYMPLRNSIIGETKKLPVDPYTYGVWLGDGTNKQPRITLSNNDKFILDNIPYEITSIHNGINDNVKSYQIKGLVQGLHKLGLCYQDKTIEKFIHDSYLTSSVEQRLELLAGLLDTDGHLDKKKNRYIFTTCEEKLKNSFISLIGTFGWRCSVTIVKPKLSTSGILGKKDTYYIGFSPTMEIPCKLERKQLKQFSKQRKIGIKNIEFIEPVEGNCISVDGGLYLVGKTLKMTHNTYPEKISEAWSFGYDDTGTILSLCSNEDVVKGGSRTVIDEIKSEAFGEVFPHLKYNENDKNFFLKETDSNWKLKNCKLSSSYYAKTVQSNVVGSRASKRIHIDDLYPDYKEAMNQSLNEYYLNKYVTVWCKRYVQHLIPKIVVTGTLWASGDFIALLINLQKKLHKFKKHRKYKYTWVSEDESVVIIQVPALDYETGLSTCPELRTTKEILQERDTMDEYLFNTNFQQIPTDPESLFFSYNKLRTYERIPETEYTGTYAVIDATRKSGKDFFAMPVFTKVPNENGFDYYLKDCLFTRTATKDMYNDVVKQIIDNHIIELVIESNVTSELKQNIEKILAMNNVGYCIITEKYNSENKQIRIQNEKGNILKKLVFPKKGMFGVNTHIGRFMENLTLYNDGGRNPNDDAPDCCGMFTKEIIDGGAKPAKARAIKRLF